MVKIKLFIKQRSDFYICQNFFSLFIYFPKKSVWGCVCGGEGLGILNVSHSHSDTSYQDVRLTDALCKRSCFLFELPVLSHTYQTHGFLCCWCETGNSTPSHVKLLHVQFLKERPPSKLHCCRLNVKCVDLSLFCLGLTFSASSLPVILDVICIY